MRYMKVLGALLFGAIILVSNLACSAAENSASAAISDMEAVKTASTATAINWFRNVEEAKATASERDTIIMVDVYTDWCHWCKELDKNVFTDQRVIDLSTGIVSLKVNAEDNGQGTALANEFGVEGFPTILFITADGREVDRIGGYLPSEEFSKSMEKIIKGDGTYLSYSKALDEGTLQISDHVDALEKFMSREDETRVKKVAEALDPSAISDAESREKAYTLLVNYNLSNENFEKAENLLVEFIRAFPDSQIVPRLHFLVVIANIYQKDLAEAEEYLEIMKEQFPKEEQLIAQAEQMIKQVS